MRGGSSALYIVLGKLDQAGVRQTGTGYEAHCPTSRHAQGDRHPSLSVGVGDDGRVLFNCHGGCDTADVLAALGLTWGDLFEKRGDSRVRRFRLPSSNGTVVEHVRVDMPEGGGKDVWWETNGKPGLNGVPVVDLPLYGAQHLDSVPVDIPVIVCEGEKSAQALIDAGLVAVGTVTGADKTPSDTMLVVLVGRSVWLWPDNDDIGRGHMQRIADQLGPQTGVRWITWPDAPKGGDAADYLERGLPVTGIVDLLEPLVTPPPMEEPRTTSERPKGRGPRLDVVRMSDVTAEAIDWLWRGRLARGKPSLMMGDPGIGKSLITHTCASIVSTGGLWPDGTPCERGTAILFTVEDGLGDTVKPRLQAAGADMNRVIAVRGVLGENTSNEERMFALTEHLAMLEELIVRERAIFVAMDPITAYLGEDVNSHRGDDVRRVLGPLQMMCERTRIALIMLMHLTKGTGVSALYRAAGSIAFPAVARIVLGVAPDPNDAENQRKLLLPVKMNIDELPTGIGYRIRRTTDQILPLVGMDRQPPVLVWDSDPVTVDASSAMDRGGTIAEMGALAECKAALNQIGLTCGGRCLAREGERQLKDANSLPSPATLVRARRELGIRTRKEGFQGAWYWEWQNLSTKPRSETLDGMDPLKGSYDPIDTNDSKHSIPSSDSVPARAHAREKPVCRACGGVLAEWEAATRYQLHADCTLPA